MSCSGKYDLIVDLCLLAILQVWFANAQENKPNVTGTCGGVIRGQYGGEIASPGFPDKQYPSLANCTYDIEVEPGSVVAYKSLYMDLERGCHDMVEIWPEGEQTQPGIKYCGKKVIPLNSSSGNRLVVRFLSDHATAYNGFAMTWYSLDLKSLTPSFNCSFDGPIALCPGWMQVENGNQDDLDWMFSRDKTPTQNTGPSSDHSGEYGRFAYLEGSGAEFSDKAALLSPEINMKEQCKQTSC